MQDKWLNWAIRMQAIAQSGLFYSTNKYDLERFQQIRDLSIEIMGEYTQIEESKIKDLFCSECGYQTPKIDVRAAIIENGRILLVKEQIDGKWSMPGGWAEVDLSLSENVKKEVKEEAGLEVDVQKLVAVLDVGKTSPIPMPYGIYRIMTICTRLGGSFAANIETMESGFFELDNLPVLSPGRTTRDQIMLCLNAVNDDAFAPVFD